MRSRPCWPIRPSRFRDRIFANRTTLGQRPHRQEPVPSRKARPRDVSLSLGLGCCLAVLGSLPGQSQVVDKRVADLGFVLSTITREHPEPQRLHGEAVWAARQASLRFRLENLDEAQFALELQSLVALLGDSNTQLLPVAAVPDRLPLQFGAFPDGVFVIGAQTGFADRLGERLESVEGRPVAEVLDRLRPLLSADNPQVARDLGATRLADPALLYTAGLAADPGRLQVRLLRPGGSARDWTIETTSTPDPAADSWSRVSRPVAGTKAAPPPLGSRRLAPDLGYLPFATGSGGQVDVGKQLAAWADEPKVQRLVVDLRGALSGPERTRVGGPVSEWIERIGSSRWNVKGGLFVITDVRMAAAAMDLALALDQSTEALFVGGATRWRPARQVEVQDRPLPHAPLTLRLATQTVDGAQRSDRRLWIAPDIPAPTTFADLRNGRDAALAAIRRHPQGADAAAEGRALVRSAEGNPRPPRWQRTSQLPALSSGTLAARVEPAAVVAKAAQTPGRETYLGRTIAQTMHWRGAEWLMRRTREDEEHSTRMLDALGLVAGLSVCDMGCGNGFHTLRMAERVAPHGWVYGADIQEPMLAMLKRRQARREIDNIVLVHNSLDDPGLPQQSCDLILMVDVYHEFSHPVRMLAGLHRALKPGGKLVLVEFRSEDPEVPIKRLHKMSKAQINKEMAANGFALCGQFDELPWQHVMMFSPERRQ